MKINFNDELNIKLQNLAISKEILNINQHANKLALSFKLSDIYTIANAIKDANNEKFNFKVDASFEKQDYSYLQHFDFDYSIDSIVDDLIKLKKETLTIFFKTEPLNNILNLLISGEHYTTKYEK